MVKNNYTSEGEKSEARQELPRETPAGENATLPAPIRELEMEAAIGAKLGLEGHREGDQVAELGRLSRQCNFLIIL